MIKRFIEWLEYMGTTPMTDISAKDEIIGCLAWVVFLALVSLIGCIADWLERWWNRKDDT